MIHRAAFTAAESDWSYVAFEVEPGRGAAALDAMRTLGLVGLSVTMPHKQEVARSVDRLDPSAAALGSVNTVSWDGEELVGSSTDGDGFIASLRDHGVEVTDAKVVVLGAGGAARSVIDALARHGAADIAILNRSPKKAEDAADLAAQARVGRQEDLGVADIVVNATSVGMGVEPTESAVSDMPCNPMGLSTNAIVADLVYQPRETAWLDAAREHVDTVIGGLGMLIHQAAGQQLIWTGENPDIAAMRRAAENELRRRVGEG